MNETDFDVVVIGAGASGIAALEQLTKHSSFKVVCFELRLEFGGVWSLDGSRKCDEFHVNFDQLGRPFVQGLPLDSTPLYDGLRTNVPTELMAYRNKPFPESSAQYPPGLEVSKYLHHFSRGLEKHVQFGCRVTRVRYPHAGENRTNGRRWIIEVEDMPGTSQGSLKARKVHCDFVLCANGHYTVPYIPYIPSLSTWPKKIIHSCIYHTATNPIFHDQTVAVVGIGPSGYDIIRELAILREQTHLANSSKRLYSVASHPPKLGWDFNDPSAPSWSRQITTVPRFTHIHGNKIYLENGCMLDDVDLICFATGYLYSFPFCHDSDSPWKANPLICVPSPLAGCASDILENADSSYPRAGLRVHNIDENQIFYYPDPSFAFLVLNTQVVPFPLAEYQVRAVTARWSGRRCFPLAPFKNKADETRSVHALPPPQEFEIENKLLELIGEGGDKDTDDHWGFVPKWKYKSRSEIPETRRRELGY
ncbi:hypothetical protein O181_031682 [Austropuccinia psidii MF-1]|uniref:Flavin-containing monooxygenase n=1 Tax=Austropuccinia psidii MF-1 TaxID=1389203 RepID=A0A9Q3H5K3_9BASI|nr:hypothetical protein [Austropuccinia psidii MF-1]